MSETSIFERRLQPEDSLPDRVAILGASGGIGAAIVSILADQYPGLRVARSARDLDRLPAISCQHADYVLDFDEPEEIGSNLRDLLTTHKPAWVFLTTGWLHDESHHPEKRLRDLDAQHLALAFQRNTIGPALVLRAIDEALPRQHALRVGVLSARVGSISDNRLGGWHSYRASKAALNMLIKNCAIEWNRAHANRIVVGLQPGTTDTALSGPFQRNVPEGHLQTPAFTAQRLINVMQHLRPEDSGGLFDFEGLSFEP